MGFKDFLIKTVEDTKLNYQESKKRQTEIRQQYIESSKHTKVDLTIISGLVGFAPNSTIQMRQKADGLIYFGFNQNVLYHLIEYEWEGPKYTTVTNSNKTGTHTTKGKAGKIGGGAVVGLVVGGPVGAAVGGAMGAGSKGKKSIHEHTISTTEQIEVNTPAILKFKNASTGELINLAIVCNTLINTQIKCFNTIECYTHPTNTSTIPTSISNSVEEVKKLKELLDMGILTQEEFETKKNQLLGL